MTEDSLYEHFRHDLEQWLSDHSLVVRWEAITEDGIYGVKLTDDTPVSLGVNVTP